MIRQLLVTCLVLAVGCGAKKKDDPPVAADAAPVATATATASSSASAAAPAGAKHAAHVYEASYKVTAGTMYIPTSKDWSSAKFKNDDTSLLGDGSLTLEVDGDDMVTGSTSTGPLGAGVITGRVENKTLTATLRRKDPKDMGLTGTMVGSFTDKGLEGTMQLADATSSAVRVGTFNAPPAK